MGLQKTNMKSTLFFTFLSLLTKVFAHTYTSETKNMVSLS